jgi:hypothetical protein
VAVTFVGVGRAHARIRPAMRRGKLKEMLSDKVVVHEGARIAHLVCRDLEKKLSPGRGSGRARHAQR